MMVLALLVALQQQPVKQADSDAFRPLELPAPTAARTASGAPGPGYWQQKVDYTIAVSLDTAKHTITGTETIRYHNRSPDTLRVLWLQLDQNVYRTDWRTHLSDSARAALPEGFAGGYTISTVSQNLSGALQPVATTVDGTLMRVDLARALAPRDSSDIKIVYSFPIPANGSDRLGRARLASGWLYAIAQWYPRLAVYDDLSGWNTDQYRGQGEFYLEYGDVDYAITLPHTFVVIGTGELMNAADVLSASEQRKLALARASDTTVKVISGRAGARVKNTPNSPTTASRTWRFRATNVRDVAWAASPALEWQASGWRGVLVQTAFPPEASADWRNALRVVRQTLRDYSKHWLTYPYPTVAAIGAPINGGMEYPMLSFIPLKSAGRRLERVLLHETGHQWLPMIVGSNERRHPWMDEGLDTFINWVSIGRKPTGKGDTATKQFATGRTGPIAQHADSIPPADYQAVAYDGADEGLELLRYEIVPDTTLFDRAFREYIRRWQFKHPAPADFFRTMNDQLGADYSWFWRWWFYETRVVDLAVDSVQTDSTGETRSARIFLSNPGEVPMLVPLTFRYANGSSETVKIPVEVWRSDNYITINRSIPDELLAVEIDAAHNIPDGNRNNNSWQRR